MVTISVASDKGGVGKSLISILLAEWLLYNDRQVWLVDADANETSAEWISYCAQEGRQVSNSINPDFRIIDTGGRQGASATHLREADLVLVPFQPYVSDVSRTVGWFLKLSEEHQYKVIFIPNRLKAPILTVEQRAGIAEIEKLIEETGRGRIVIGLTDRVAIYPLVFNGGKENFFERNTSGSYRNALEEADELFRSIYMALPEEVD